MSELQDQKNNAGEYYISECNTEKPFVFISYCSKDKNVVWRDVQYLQQMGFNIWIDHKNMQAGNTWNEEAIHAIQSMNCKLFIYYVSKDSLCSKPCLEELRTTRDEKTVMRHCDKELKIIPIDVEPISDIIDFKNELYQIIEKDTERRTADKEQAVETISYIIREFFSNNNGLLRIKSQNNPGRIKGYYDEIIQALPEETCAEDKREQLRALTKRFEEEQALAAQEELAKKQRIEAEERRLEEEKRLARIAEENRIRKENEKKTRRLAMVNDAVSGSANTSPNSQAFSSYQAPPAYTTQVPHRKKSMLPKLLLVAAILIVFVFAGQLKQYIDKTKESRQSAELSVNTTESGSPSDTAAEAEPEAAGPVNLKDMGPLNAQCVDDTLSPSSSFSADGRIWDRSMLFRAGNGHDEAFCEWNIGGEYKTLSLKALPYIYDGDFFESSVCDLQVVNAETGEILFSETLTYNSEMIDEAVDVTDVNRLRIIATKKKSLLAYIVVDGGLSADDLAEESAED